MSDSPETFKSFLQQQWVTRGRMVGVVGIIFYVALTAYDYLLYPGTLLTTTAIRFSVVALLGILIWLSTRKWALPYGHLIVTAGIVAYIASSDLCFHVQGVQGHSDRVFAITSITFVVFYLLPMRGVAGMVYLATIYVSYLIEGAIFGYPPTKSFALPYLIQAAIICSVGIIGNRVFLATKRKELEATQALAQRTSQLAQAKAELEIAFNELKASQAALARAEGLAAVSELVNGVAHEINNPLASARSLLESLEEDLARLPPESAAEINETLGIVRGAIDRARALILELRSLSSEVHNAPEHVDLRVLLREVVHAIENTAKKQGAAYLEALPEGDLHVRATHAQINRIFMCLLDNAVDAEKKAGREPHVRLSASRNGGRIQVTISDQGRGIPGEIREKIFQPFFTTRRDEHRPGLGLYLAHEIIRSLGGHIAVDSAPGSGTRVEVELPLAPAA